MMLTVSLLVCAMMALTGAAVDSHIIKRSTPCPGGWTPYKDRCFTYVSTPMTWAHAERTCQNQGGNLASVHSFEEHHVIQAMILLRTHSYPFTWLGGYDAAQEDIWFWSDGSPFNFEYWDVGQPDDHARAHCLVMNYGEAKKFDDQSCFARRPFVCAKKL
ncbi:type-2 ice-structuring protein-like [Chelmon rostratus]|uniref:type-2 ice-structuring protein-like n=1 Tax=Chelmon rostratus TaxID=109905 RepID=UPI001BEB32F1|nr:type-2 ice-structuring protein-like [Chelmon rostratus]